MKDEKRTLSIRANEMFEQRHWTVKNGHYLWKGMNLLVMTKEEEDEDGIKGAEKRIQFA